MTLYYSYLNLTVKDSNAPVISNCPHDTTHYLPSNKSDVQVTWNEPSALDDVTPASLIKRTQTHTPGQNFPIGKTKVTYTFTDEAGNTSVCSFNVIVTRKYLSEKKCWN